MSRRRSRDRINVPTRKEIAEKHRKLCAKEKHIWRPSFTSERLGATPQWDGGLIHCEYCHVQYVFDKLDANDRELVTATAKVLTEVNERVAQLCPRRTFSDSGI